ncbi:MAG: DUF1365 domain-containing protein [Bdellovibrionales bacterium]|nr:DUF1365 domain-containing protein [Bdellovibrionales bacterium]
MITLYKGQTRHFRKEPEVHSFSYQLYFFEVVLTNGEEVRAVEDRGKSLSPILRTNSLALFSFYERDYINKQQGSIFRKLESLLIEREIETKLGKAILYTSARFLGYVFNPVNFYLLFDKEDQFFGTVAEVRNTFEERHIYVLTDSECIASNQYSFTFPKEFFVSPFFPQTGSYNLHVKLHEGCCNIAVHLLCDGKPIFSADLTGKRVPTSKKRLVLTAITSPLQTFLTMSRIHWQALLLLVRRRLGVFQYPLRKHHLTHSLCPHSIWPSIRKKILPLVRRATAAQKRL